jgi:hypothetical protein
MPVSVTEAERASFLRRGRPWDVAAGMRQNPEPANRPAAPDLDRAIRAALAVYYFPGMWDWDNGVRLPLVGQELDRSIPQHRRMYARAREPARVKPVEQRTRPRVSPHLAAPHPG